MERLIFGREIHIIPRNMEEFIIEYSTEVQCGIKKTRPGGPQNSYWLTYQVALYYNNSLNISGPHLSLLWNDRIWLNQF